MEKDKSFNRGNKFQNMTRVSTEDKRFNRGQEFEQRTGQDKRQDKTMIELMSLPKDIPSEINRLSTHHDYWVH